MPVLLIEKVVASLPSTLTPNTLYCVRAGVGFDLYCSDSTGAVAHKVNSGSGGGGGGVSTLNTLAGDLELSLSQSLSASALDPVKKAATATLTNGRRTVTFTATQSVAIGDLAMDHGKYCFAVKFVSGTTSGNAAVGVATTTISNYAHQIGYDLPQEVGMFQNFGNIYADTSSAGSGTGFSTVGDEVQVAVDTDNRKVWFRVNAGNWNGSPTNNPETGVGGVTIAGTAAIVPAVCTDEASVWDFKPSGFAHAAPTGFGTWSGATDAATVVPRDLRIESPEVGQIITFNGTEWYNGDPPSGGSGPVALSSLDHTGASAGKFIRSNGTAWVVGDNPAAGREMIPIAAGFLRPSSTGGATVLTAAAMGTNMPDVVSINFGQTTQVFAQFDIPLPPRWDRGTITARFRWSHANTTTNFGVVWQLQAVAIGDNETMAVAFGTAQKVADTGGVLNRFYTTAETPPITIANSPALGDTIFFRVARVPADAADNLNAVCRLQGIDLFITTTAGNDA